MRIFSKFHDYYDGVVGYDSDPKRVYNREDTKYINFKEAGLKKQTFLKFPFYFDPFIIGFCGKIYPGIDVHNYSSGKPDFVYSYQDFLDVIYTRKLEINDAYIEFAKYFFNKEKYFGWAGEVSSFKNEYNYLFLKYHVPYFVVSIHNLVINPVLKDYHFYKIFDTYSCYQKIDSYLFNELVPPDEINHVVPDVLKAQSHGFDKFSFRKQKCIN